MQVALNSDEEYDGGRLVFATSEGFVVPARCTGSATIHTCSVAHGVTALTRGVRYGLFLSDTRGSTLESMRLMGVEASPHSVDGVAAVVTVPIEMEMEMEEIDWEAVLCSIH
jgi:hypothetical protein